MQSKMCQGDYQKVSYQINLQKSFSRQHLNLSVNIITDKLASELIIIYHNLIPIIIFWLVDRNIFFLS